MLDVLLIGTLLLIAYLLCKKLKSVKSKQQYVTTVRCCRGKDSNPIAGSK